MKIEYITSNAQKFEEACHILADWELERVDMDLTEVQGSSEEVIEAKAKEAFNLLKRPLIVEDVSLCCPAIGGLPGPYIKDFLKKIGDRGLCELIHKYADHSVQVKCLAAFIEPGKLPVLFEGVVNGTIVFPRGETRHGPCGWNPIVQPAGMDKTYGEMTIEEHSRVSMRFLALTKLDAYLVDRFRRASLKKS